VVHGIDDLLGQGYACRHRVWLSQERADGCDCAEKGDRQQQRHNEPAEIGASPWRSEPAIRPTPSSDRDGLPSDRAGIERSRGESSPRPEALLEPRFEIKLVSHR
jgi:hypothetical protein